MQQVYHANAKTNVNIRQQIQNNSTFSNEEMAKRFQISTQTVSKWKNRETQMDAPCRPNNIKYALSDLEVALILSIRTSTWFSLDEVWEMVLPQNETISRSCVYRCFKKNKINAKPEEEKEKLKKFKEYEPGYLHIDVTYLPKLDGLKRYLFVAIDRATRTMLYLVYDHKTADCTQDFFEHCMDFFPFQITHILTDNGLEFTNKLLKSKKGNPCDKLSLLDEKCEENNIDHRLTKPGTPKTNRMVERVNGIIKSNTIAKIEFQNVNEMKIELLKFLIYYNLERRHGALIKELKVKTPFNAVEKWYELKPEIFKTTPSNFKNKILLLKQVLFNSHQQPHETRHVIILFVVNSRINIIPTNFEYRQTIAVN